MMRILQLMSSNDRFDFQSYDINDIINMLISLVFPHSVSKTPTNTATRM